MIKIHSSARASALAANYTFAPVNLRQSGRRT
jgi:hypothetical protein